MNSLLLSGALALIPTAALAQEAPATSTSAPAAVGPTSLQDFTLNGTVTHAADQPASTQPAVPKRETPPAQPTATPTDTAASPAPAAVTRQAAAPERPAPRVAQSPATAPAAPPRQAAPQPAPELLRQSQPASSVTAALPSLNESGTGTAAAAPAASDFAPPPAPLDSGRGFPILPWLLAALALALGGGFLFWRSRSRAAFAGGPQMDLFAAPEPQPEAPPAPIPPRAQPAPAPAPAPAPVAPGIVSTSLRPWIEIGFNPTRVILDNEALVVEFELELFNSASAAARTVRVDAALFNAGPTQDEQIGGFIASPVARGESIEIPPLKRVGLKTRVGIARDQVQAYEIAGKQVFLPVIAFNALYGWGSSEGQTSATYLLGRDTAAEKVAPFRIDLGPRIFRQVAARLLPTGLRR